MAFSSAAVANFIHFPTTRISPRIPSPTLRTRYYLPPPPPQHRRGSVRVKCNGDAKSSETGSEGKKNNDPLPTFQKVLKGIMDKDTVHLTEAAATAFSHTCNSNPFFPISRARLLMMDYACRLVNSLRKSIVFSVTPTTKCGSIVGVKWKLGWEEIMVTLGKGINITFQNTFRGKLLLGNLETIMDPLLQLMPKLMNSNMVPEEKWKKIAISLFLGFFLLLLSLFLFQFSVR